MLQHQQHQSAADARLMVAIAYTAMRCPPLSCPVLVCWYPVSVCFSMCAGACHQQLPQQQAAGGGTPSRRSARREGKGPEGGRGCANEWMEVADGRAGGWWWVDWMNGWAACERTSIPCHHNQLPTDGWLQWASLPLTKSFLLAFIGAFSGLFIASVPWEHICACLNPCERCFASCRKRGRQPLKASAEPRDEIHDEDFDFPGRSTEKSSSSRSRGRA